MFIVKNRIFDSSKRILTILISASVCIALLLPSVGCTSVYRGQDRNSMDICISSEPQTIDPGLSSTVDGTTMISHLFSGLASWQNDGNGGSVIKAEGAESLPEPIKKSDGTYVYTYHLLKNATWNDGTPVTAKDYVFAWNRSASVELASDFSYMFELVVGYEDIWADEPPEGAKLDVVALDDFTLQVHTTAKVPYWNELLAFPVFMPLREDCVDMEGMWATKAETYMSNGPYTLKNWSHNSLITLEKREEYPNSGSVTMPVLNFYLSDNANNQLANFKTGDWEFVKTLPTNEVSTIKNEYPDIYHCDENIGIYFISWQVNKDLSPIGGRTLTDREQEEVRGAISLLIDRNYICDYVTQAGQIPASTFVPKGIKESDGSEFYKNAGGKNKSYDGYFATDADSIESNYKQAVEILKKYYSFNSDGFIENFPGIVYIYNTNEAHKAIAEYIQNVLDGIGIKVSLENQEWATFLSTKRVGQFNACRDSWIADYNDAQCFLDCYLSNSGNNVSQLGKGDNATKEIYSVDLSDVPGYENQSVKNGTWAQAYDKLISKIKVESNLSVRDKLMHKAEDLLMSTNCVTPIYYYTNSYIMQTNVKGAFSNPLAINFFMNTYYED